MPDHSLEIERKYLLNGLPSLPADHEVWRIRQGYFTDPIVNALDAGDGLLSGRIRQTVLPDGSILCTHTIKRGSGVVRTEIEREITREQFDRHWPRTAGRRLNKVRRRVKAGDVMWEIDQFEELALVLAEVELEGADQAVAFPGWLEPHVVREVTDDPAFTNAAIAARLSSQAGFLNGCAD
jgi:adenylate cyclase